MLGTQKSIFIYNTHEYQLEIPPQVYVIPAYQDISTPRFIYSPRKTGCSPIQNHFYLLFYDKYTISTSIIYNDLIQRYDDN